MLPVVSGDRAPVRRIVAYTVALVGFTVVPFATGTFGLTYLISALALGGVFLVLALRLGNGERRRAAFAFHYSLLYLALLFAAAAVDVSV
jgi:heme o synthase